MQYSCVFVATLLFDDRSHYQPFRHLLVIFLIALVLKEKKEGILPNLWFEFFVDNWFDLFLNAYINERICYVLKYLLRL